MKQNFQRISPVVVGVVIILLLLLLLLLLRRHHIPLSFTRSHQYRESLKTRRSTVTPNSVRDVVERRELDVGGTFVPGGTFVGYEVDATHRPSLPLKVPSEVISGDFLG